MSAQVDYTPPIDPDCLCDDPTQRLDDLAQIISTYNRVTQKLQQSHEALGAEVLRLQRELASTDAQLQRSRRLAALGEMAAGIAHEIRNPLSAIHLYARMIVEDLQELQGPTCHEVRHNAQQIVQAVRGLNAIVNDVLSFTREIRPRPVRLAVTDLFTRAVEAHRPSMEQAQVKIVRNESEEAMWLQGDPHLLHQALVNLLRNSVEAMMPDGGTLTLGCGRTEDQVILTVADTGPGINKADIDRIFNPFFTTRNTGTGLGLAIVHRIVDAHGGAISVSNHDGAVFTLNLPLPQSLAAYHSPSALIGASV